MPTDFKRTEFNLFVLRQLNKAESLADKIYWKGMFR
jgi:hypothetical protein